MYGKYENIDKLIEEKARLEKELAEVNHYIFWKEQEMKELLGEIDG